MSKNKLRVCEYKYRKGTFYFHRWAERGMTHFHPTEQSKDTTYVEVVAILECESTGEVFTASPSSITFID